MTVKHKEDLVSRLNTLRADLMTMQAGITHEDQIPNPEQIRAAVNKLESMLEVIERES